jgi:DUF1365 family protein
MRSESMGSAIYEGTLHHRRLAAPGDEFAHPIWMLLLDLDEAEEALEAHPLWSARRPAPVRWRRADHLGPADRPLDEAARDLVEDRTGQRPAGPVRLLTMPRMLGVGFNPVSFFYLYGRSGELEAAIAEVTSTPWGERHLYVQRAEGGRVAGRMAKRMHVSPFMAMQQTYEWSMDAPGRTLGVRIASLEGGRPVFEASLSLARRELDREAMGRLALRRPPQPPLVLARIYAHALRLRLRGAAYHRRPAEGASPSAAQTAGATTVKPQPKEVSCESA